MNLKKKPIYYIIGLIIAFITLITPIPKIIRYPLAILPILYFGADAAMQYMKELSKKAYINRYLTSLLVTLGLVITGKLSYAAMTIIFFSAAEYFFDKFSSKAMDRIEGGSAITTPFAKAFADGKTVRVSTASIVPGQVLMLEAGDIIPCECTVINGEAELDYTNVFGKGSLRNAAVGTACFSGGIVQHGKLAVKATKTAKDSLAAVISSYTKRAAKPSLFQKKLDRYAKLLEPVFYALAFVVFLILIIATKDFSLSVNQASVILAASSAVGLSATLPMLNRNALLRARRRGAIFASVEALEQSGKVGTVSVNEAIAPEALAKIEETGVVPAKGGYTAEDAVIYRDKARLESDSNPTFKMALGFFSQKASATALDANPERIAGAIRTGKHHRGVLTQNLLLLLVEKLAVIALVFLLNITPAAAVVIEFAAWTLCMLNATKDL